MRLEPDQDFRRAAAFDNRILHGLVGSTVHGLELVGQDDRDEMGVFIEPPESAVGLRAFEHWVERTQPEGVRSGPGDLDLTLYSLRKFVRLALAGNPSILLLLFVPDDQLQLVTRAGCELRELAPAFISVRVREAYSGYMAAQRERLLGERGQMRVKRPELIEAHGYDTKYAMHTLRLGLQGVELLETGRLSLPMREPERSTIMSIRRGDVSFAAALELIDAAEARLAECRPERDEPDRDRIEQWLVATHLTHWSEHHRPTVGLRP
jgi:predicted nucleotidyltransferase